MQWSNGTNAGFTTGNPWLTINPNFTQVNVDESEKDPNSILNFVKKMIALRKEHKDVMVYGKYTLLDKENTQVYSYTRESGNKRFLVLLNFTGSSSKANTGIDLTKAKVLINNDEKPATDGSLRPYEAVIYEL
jgi:oligo-1,6-glucosidase